MRKISDAHYNGNRRYNNKVYEGVGYRAKKADRINDLLDIAAAKHSVSKAAYIHNALMAALAADGVTLADLPTDTAADADPDPEGD